MHAAPTALLVATLFLATTTAPAEAQTGSPDHLECFRLKTKKNGWIVDDHAFDRLTFRPVLPELGIDRNCELLPARNPRPREVCVPAEKAPQQPPSGSGYLTDAMLCYDARCDAGDTDEAVSFAGQFGGGESVVRRKLRNRRLCVPATVCHDVCEEGPPLQAGCGECAARVCEAEPLCCEFWWLSFCVARAAQLCGETCPGVPTPSPVPTPTPFQTPTPVPTPTSVPGPACSTAKVTMTIGFNPVLFPDVAGVTVTLEYPSSRMDIPGSGSDPRVLERVEFLSGSGGGIAAVGDNDLDPVSILNIGRIDLLSPILPGPFAAATFDCVGAGGPNLEDLSCSVDASTFEGNTVPAACGLTLETTPGGGSASGAFLLDAPSLID